MTTKEEFEKTIEHEKWGVKLDAKTFGELSPEEQKEVLAESKAKAEAMGKVHVEIRSLTFKNLTLETLLCLGLPYAAKLKMLNDLGIPVQEQETPQHAWVRFHHEVNGWDWDGTPEGVNRHLYASIAQDRNIGAFVLALGLGKTEYREHFEGYKDMTDDDELLSKVWDYQFSDGMDRRAREALEESIRLYAEQQAANTADTSA